MKFCLILITFTVLFLAAEVSTRVTRETVTVKGVLRDILREIIPIFYNRAAEVCYPRQLSYRETRNSKQQQQECVSAIINVFVNKIYENHSLEDVKRNFQENYIGDLVKGICEVYNDMAACTDYNNPLMTQIQNYCRADYEGIIQKHLIISTPIIFQTFCLRNDHLNAEIFENSDMPKCQNSFIYNMIEMGFTGNLTVESAANESTDAQNSCNRLLNGNKDKYAHFGECSPRIYTMVRTLLDNFCEATECDRHFPMIQCDLSQ